MRPIKQNKSNLKMKKLLAVLMIAGLTGFASCGSGEQKADETTATDSTMAAPAEETAPATDAAAPADTAAMADTSVHQ